jgi:hypothetical protein
MAMANKVLDDPEDIRKKVSDALSHNKITYFINRKEGSDYKARGKFC